MSSILVFCGQKGCFGLGYAIPFLPLSEHAAQCLLCEHGELSLNLQLPCERCSLCWILSLSHRKTKTGKILELRGWAVQPNPWAPGSARGHAPKHKEGSRRHQTSVSGLCMHSAGIYAHATIHMYHCICWHKLLICHIPPPVPTSSIWPILSSTHTPADTM